LYKENGLSPNFNETIAHAIHSLTLNELRKFNPLAVELNGVPVVNPRLNDRTETERVIPHAPEEEISNIYIIHYFSLEVLFSYFLLFNFFKSFKWSRKSLN